MSIWTLIQIVWVVVGVFVARRMFRWLWNDDKNPRQDGFEKAVSLFVNGLISAFAAVFWPIALVIYFAIMRPTLVNDKKKENQK